MRLVGGWAALVWTAALGACGVDLAAPTGVPIGCEDGKCPSGYSCNPATRLCDRGAGNRPPSVVLDPVQRALETVTLSFAVADPNGAPFGDDRVSVLFEYSVDGATYCPITALDAPTTSLEVAATGTAYTRVWNVVAEGSSGATCPLPIRSADTDGDAAADTQVLAFVGGLRVRATPTDSSDTPLSGASIERGPSAMGNEPPELTLELDPGSHAGKIVVPFRVEDTLGGDDVTSVELAYRMPGESDFRPALVEYGGTSGLTADGIVQVIVWDSLAALGQGGVGALNVDGVVVRLRALDVPVAGRRDFGAWQMVTIDLVNQSPPRVEFLSAEVDAPGRASGGVLVSYRLADAEGDLADVRIEYAVDGSGDWHRCTELPVRESEGRYGLSTRGADGAGVVHRFVWDPIADLGAQGPGSLQIRVTGADPLAGVGVGTIASVSGTIGIKATLATSTSYGLAWRHATSGGFNGRVELLDVNADGRQEVLIEGTDFQVARGGAFAGLGDGSLGSASTYDPVPAQHFLHRFVARDLNGDQRDDLVINTAPSIDVYRANAATGLLERDATASFSISRDTLSGLALGDLDGDGHVDIVYTNSNAIHVALGTPGGTFIQDSTTYRPNSSVVPRLAVGDFDDDGFEDVAGVDWTFSGATAQIVVYRGQARAAPSDPCLRAPVVLPQRFQGFDRDTASEDEWRHVEITAGDLNGDGYADLAIADITLAVDTRVSAYLGGGAGLSSFVTGGRARGWPTRVRAVDIDGDGRDEVVSVSRRAASGAGELSKAMIGMFGLRAPAEDGLVLVDSLSSVSTCASSSVVDFDAADLDQDGRADLAVAWTCSPNSHLDVWLSSKPPELPALAFSDTWRGEVGARPNAIELGDVDRDGVIDVVWGDNLLDGQLVLRGEGDLVRRSGRVNLVSAEQMRAGGTVSLHTYGIGDVNGDRLPDAVMVDTDFCRLFILPSVNSTTPWAAEYGAAGITPWGLCSGRFALSDLTDDGLDDIIIADGPLFAQVANTANGVWDGTFTELTLTPISGGLTDVSVIDLNGDGILDVAAGVGSNLYVVYGQGTAGESNGTFATACSRDVTTTLQALAAGDFDDDGLGEVLITRSDGATGSLLETVDLALAGCSMTVTPVTSLAVATRSAFADDLNGDGVLDVVLVTADVDRRVFIAKGASLRGLATGRFDAPVEAGLPRSIVAAHAADMNGDGLLDLVAAGFATQPGNTPDVAIYTAPGRRWNRWERWGYVLPGAATIGELVPAGSDAFGDPFEAPLAMRPFRGTGASASSRHEARDAVSLVRRSGLARARDNRLAPLTRAYEVLGDEILTPDLTGEAGRWRIAPRLGRAADGSAIGLDLSGTPQRGVIVDLPVIDGLAATDLSTTGREVRVFLRTSELLRAESFAGDPLFSSTTGASSLPVVTDVQSGSKRPLHEELQEWTELPRAVGDVITSGSGPRFAIDRSGLRPRVSVALDQLGVVQAYYVAR